MAKKKSTPTIVITGGTGSGKSTVAEEFKKLGARVVDVDRVAHRLLKPGNPAWHEILWEFCGAKLKDKKQVPAAFKPSHFIDSSGKALPELPWVIMRSGQIRRDRLGATVFSNPEALLALNKITHPRLRKLLDAKVSLHQKISTRPLILDMAVYPERVFRGLGDLVLWVRAPGGLRVQRLADSKRLNLEEASERVRIQPKDAEYKKLADYVLPNLGSDMDVRKGAQVLWPRLMSKFSGRGNAC